MKTFIQVAESGSLSKASDQLRLAQSALSRHVRLLEAELGFDLFIRYRRGMLLTEAGSDLYKTMGDLLSQMEKAIDDARSGNGNIRGEVALGLMPTTSVVLASRLALRVSAELPDVRLRIVEGYAGHLINWLQRGQIDLTLLYGPSADYHLRTTELLYEELMLIGRRDSGFDYSKAVKLIDLDQLPLVQPSRPHGLRVLVENSAEKQGITLNIAFEADSYRVLLDLVAAGIGYTLLPLSALKGDLESRDLTYVQVENGLLKRQILLAQPDARRHTKAAQAVTDIILHEIAGLVASGIWPAYPGEAIRRLMQKPG